MELHKSTISRYNLNRRNYSKGDSLLVSSDSSNQLNTCNEIASFISQMYINKLKT